VRKWDDVTDLLSQAKATVTKLLSHALPGERLSVYALAADPEGDQLQAFGDSNLDETNDDEIEAGDDKQSLMCGTGAREGIGRNVGPDVIEICVPAKARAGRGVAGGFGRVAVSAPAAWRGAA